ncbi:hypothetical protein CBM2587_A20321 [Cupriavidus taiwanensis]|uniref:Uncharacterized protein n=1 Tax=Cupriavidus taiwanensis TaxID=164546 RepID=A0A375BQM3_9BURK|nr:hypothetical protein CBM2587_A20321 [Cupriavidus taiwanensis]
MPRCGISRRAPRPRAAKRSARRHLRSTWATPPRTPEPLSAAPACTGKRRGLSAIAADDAAAAIAAPISGSTIACGHALKRGLQGWHVPCGHIPPKSFIHGEMPCPNPALRKCRPAFSRLPARALATPPRVRPVPPHAAAC